MTLKIKFIFTVLMKKENQVMTLLLLLEQSKKENVLVNRGWIPKELKELSKINHEKENTKSYQGF